MRRLFLRGNKMLHFKGCALNLLFLGIGSPFVGEQWGDNKRVIVSSIVIQLGKASAGKLAAGSRRARSRPRDLHLARVARHGKLLISSITSSPPYVTTREGRAGARGRARGAPARYQSTGTRLSRHPHHTPPRMNLTPRDHAQTSWHGNSNFFVQWLTR